MKKVIIAVEFNVEDDFNDYEGLDMFISGIMDNADFSLLKEELGIEEDYMTYISKGREETSKFEKDQHRQKLRQALKEVHGGGNTRRILTQLLENI